MNLVQLLSDLELTTLAYSKTGDEDIYDEREKLKQEVHRRFRNLENEVEQLKEVMRKYDKYSLISFAKRNGIKL